MSVNQIFNSRNHSRTPPNGLFIHWNGSSVSVNELFMSGNHSSVSWNERFMSWNERLTHWSHSSVPGTKEMYTGTADLYHGIVPGRPGTKYLPLRTAYTKYRCDQMFRRDGDRSHRRKRGVVWPRVYRSTLTRNNFLLNSA